MTRVRYPERELLVRELIDQKGKSMKEVADLLSISKSTVHASYYRAKNNAVPLSTGTK